MEFSSSDRNQKYVACATIYADASLVPEIGLGGWAYTVPALGLSGNGVAREPVWQSHEIELLALVMGLQRVRQDGCDVGKLRFFSDSSSARLLLRTYVERRPLTGLTESEVLLLTELRAYPAGTRFTVAAYTPRHLHHSWCHRAARAAVRTHIASDQALSRTLGMLRQTQAIASLLKCRERLLEKLVETERALERWRARGHPIE